MNGGNYLFNVRKVIAKLKELLIIHVSDQNIHSPPLMLQINKIMKVCVFVLWKASVKVTANICAKLFRFH